MDRESARLYARLETLTSKAGAYTPLRTIKYATVRPLAKRVELAEQMIHQWRVFSFGASFSMLAVSAWIASLIVLEYGAPLSVAFILAVSATPGLAFGILKAVLLGVRWTNSHSP